MSQITVAAILLPCVNVLLKQQLTCFILVTKDNIELSRAKLCFFYLFVSHLITLFMYALLYVFIYAHF